MPDGNFDVRLFTLLWHILSGGWKQTQLSNKLFSKYLVVFRERAIWCIMRFFQIWQIIKIYFYISKCLFNDLLTNVSNIIQSKKCIYMSIWWRRICTAITFINLTSNLVNDVIQYEVSFILISLTDKLKSWKHDICLTRGTPG